MTTPKPPVEPLIGITELATVLGVPVKTVRRWREHRQGPQGYRIGRYIKYRPSEVEAWIEQQRED